MRRDDNKITFEVDPTTVSLTSDDDPDLPSDSEIAVEQDSKATLKEQKRAERTEQRSLHKARRKEQREAKREEKKSAKVDDVVKGSMQDPHDETSETQDADTAEASSDVVAFPLTERGLRRRRNRRWWIASAITAVVIVTVGLLLWFSPLLAIRTITITGNNLLAEDRAHQLLQPVIDRPLPQIGDAQVMELLGEEPSVANVTTSAEPPSTLNVVIEEHTPVAISPQGDNFVVFSGQGNALATLSPEQAAEYELPVVATAEDVTDPELFQTITEVLGSLPDSLRALVKSASGGTMDSVQLILHDGRTVLWGSSEHAEKKSAVLQALINIEPDEEHPVSEFDVSAPDHPVTR